MSPVCSILLIGASTVLAAGITKTTASFSAYYEGGSLPLEPGRIKATIAGREVVFLHGNQRFALPLQSVTAVTYGTDIHHRSMFCFVPFLDLDKAYYVGLTWIGKTWDGKQASKMKIDAVLKLREGQYRHLVAALERLTGIKAVNADKLPAIVRYELSSRPPCSPTGQASIRRPENPCLVALSEVF